MALIIRRDRKSPNYGSRNTQRIQMLVIHATAGSARSARNWLTNPRSKVSSHYLIDKNGVIDQLVDDQYAAYHAGEARWAGFTNINGISLGIELENANTGRDPYPKTQMDALVELSRIKTEFYHIGRQMVARHSEIAVPHGRKTDPAGFAWQWYLDQTFGVLSEWRWYRVRRSSIQGANIRMEPTAESLPIGALWLWSRAFLGRSTTGQKINGDPLWIERPPEQGGGFVHWRNLELVS